MTLGKRANASTRTTTTKRATTGRRTTATSRASTRKKHPGFTREAAAVARREGVSPSSARAIIAASSRNASPAAKRKNPNLKRVRGK